MTSVISAFIQSIFVLLSGIGYAVKDIVMSVVNMFTGIILAFYHIFQGVIGFLYTNIFLLTALAGGYYVYITYVNPAAKPNVQTRSSTGNTAVAPKKTS